MFSMKKLLNPTNTLKGNIYITKSNMALLIMNIYYLSLFMYSAIMHILGYYYEPEHRIRFLRVLMILILLLSYMIICPYRETHVLSSFTVVLTLILPISTGLFVCRAILSHLKIEAVDTLILIALAMCLSCAAVTPLYRDYKVSDFFTKRRKLLKLLSRVAIILNVILVITAFSFMIKTGMSDLEKVEPSSYSTSYSPNEHYLVRTFHEVQDDGTYKNSLNVYLNLKDKKVLMGKWIYNGKCIQTFEIDNYLNLQFVWTSNNTFVVDNKTYTIK